MNRTYSVFLLKNPQARIGIELRILGFIDAPKIELLRSFQEVCCYYSSNMVILHINIYIYDHFFLACASLSLHTRSILAKCINYLCAISSIFISVFSMIDFHFLAIKKSMAFKNQHLYSFNWL